VRREIDFDFNVGFGVEKGVNSILFLLGYFFELVFILVSFLKLSGVLKLINMAYNLIIKIGVKL
jgi:hypothetical protein